MPPLLSFIQRFRRAAGVHATVALLLACVFAPPRYADGQSSAPRAPAAGSAPLTEPAAGAMLQRRGAAAAATQGTAAPAPAQGAAPASADTAEEMRVFLVTMGPGDEVWEKFGHDAIWVHDPEDRTDQAYNYGMFDFRQANFYSNFARGRMQYWMQGFGAVPTVEYYARQNRTVWLQELNLTLEQKREMKRFLLWNARPRNKLYRYDYYLDNCTTRVRDAIDRIVGGAIHARFANEPSPFTFRSETERLTVDDVPTYTGLMIGLAEPADRPITAWEDLFLPGRLRDAIRKVSVPDGHGGMRPLVKHEHIAVGAVGRAPERTEAPNRIPEYLLAGIVLAAVVAALGWAAARYGGAARAGYSVAVVLWTLLTGVGGIVLAALWMFTDHAIAYRNENLFQLDPLSLPLLVLLPALAYGARWAVRAGPGLAVAVAALSVLGFALQALPGIDQVNGVVIALALPVNLALAWTALRLRDAAGGVRVEGETADARAARRRAARGGAR
ncbi:MAG: hypothetical protein JWM27_2230 [Gemmatimonadetes bacterium]|nr:hypothetical protein [Gemmatimonadota bacterium]